MNFTTLPVPERIRKLREELFATETRPCFARARIVTDSYRRTEGGPWVTRRAAALAEVFEKMPLFLRDGELLVGQRAASLAACSVYPEYNLAGLSAETAPPEVWDYWHGRTLRDEVYASFPDVIVKVEKELAAASCTGSGTGFGHVIVDYEKVLEVGFRGIRDDARARLSETPLEDTKGRDFLAAVTTSAEGVIRWAERYAELARAEAHRTGDQSRKRELEEIAEICSRVPAEPPRTFHEALQSFWFTHLALHIEQYGWSISAGRFDQYMMPFLAADLEHRRITEDRAWELLLNLWVKFMENVGTTVGDTIFQNLTLGGQDARGADQSNALSRLCLHATVALEVNQPALSVRWHPNIDPGFWDEAMRTVAQGTGMPALFNDQVVVEALVAHGVPRNEALGYGVVGCVEASVPGRQQGVTAGGHLNVAKALELALNEGRSVLTGEMIGVATPAPESFGNFQDLWDAYSVQVRHLAAIDILAGQLAGAAQKRRGHCPLMSSILDDCVDARRDLVDGSTRYNTSGVAVFGNTNVCDAMMAIRRVVCDEKRVSWGELREAIVGDFTGHESLRALLAHGAPRFGNDLIEVDRFANEINAVHAEFFRSHTDARGGVFVSGTWPVEGHVQCGHWTAATPDGRRRGKPLADGVGACHGADTNGPTALLNSAARLDYVSHWAAGSTCNIKFPSAIATDPRGAETLGALVSGYMQSGGQQLQLNVVDTQTLRDAQLHPEDHANLIVRVAGFSAYFTQLGRDVQDEVIARTEHSLG